jgi:hypothetical protein
MNENFFSPACLTGERQNLSWRKTMIKKTICIATILLLILMIVLAVGIGSAKANTGSLQLHASELHTFDLYQFDDLDSRLLLTDVHLDPVLGDAEHLSLLTASAHSVLNFDALPTALRRELALQHDALTLDSPVPVFSVNV